MTQPQEVLRVTEDGQFIWHPEADVMLEKGNFSHASAMQHMLIALRKQRPWVGLTDEEISAASKGHMVRNTFARAIEQILKERNNG